MLALKSKRGNTLVVTAAESGNEGAFQAVLGARRAQMMELDELEVCVKCSCRQELRRSRPAAPPTKHRGVMVYVATSKPTGII